MTSVADRAPRLGLGIAALVALALPTGPPALAADPREVRLNPPEGLIRGIEFTSLGGSWYQASAITDGDLDAELTLQLPAIGSNAEPGPVIVLWQLRVVVTDAEFGDVSERLVGAPIATALLPNCDSVSNCAVRFQLSGSVAPALQAADLDWVSQTGLSVGATVIRTFEGGSLLQVVKPDLSADGDGGTLAGPSDTYGALNLSRILPADEAAPAEIPGDEFHQGRDKLYDWGTAVREALTEFTPPARPEPVPINVWMPERPDALRVLVRIDFGDQCPTERFIVFSDDRTHHVGASLYVGGARNAAADVALPVDGVWTIALVTSTGEVLNAAGLQPLGTGTGLQVGGPLRCSNGKGVFTQEGIPQIIPNPSSAGPPEAAPSAGGASNPLALALPGLAALVIGALVVLALARRKRRSA